MNVEDYAEDFSNICQGDWANVAENSVNSLGRNRPDVLALCGGISRQPVTLIGRYSDFRPEGTYCRCKGDYLNHIGRFVKYFLRRNDNGRALQTCFPSLGRSEV